MHSFTQKPIARGIQSIRAEGGNSNPAVAAMMENVTKAFAAFKETHQAELAELREAVDSHSVLMASQQMNSNGGAAARTEQEPIYAARGLRAAQISAHYAGLSKQLDEDKTITMGDFVRGVAGVRTTDGVKAALSVGSDPAGGYSVPAITMPGILDALVDQSALLSAGASIVPVDGGKSFTTAAIDTLPVPAWRNEAGAVAGTQPTLRAVTATPRSLACIVLFSRELLADSIDISRAVTTSISQAFALELDRAGLVGSGVAPMPLGLYGMEDVAKIDQVGTKFGYADLLGAYQAQLERSAPAPTAVIMAPRTRVGLAGLTDTTGQPLNAPPLVADLRQFSTNGVPINLGAGTNESLAFVGDFRVVQYVMRERLNIGVLRELYAGTGQIAFLCHARVDVVVTYPSCISVIDKVVSTAAA
ncbi:HK97 family phage major capsid protein [Paraburkholderia sp. BL18I3N2]|uniref:phage major capsid protein n=1 Tax=Paraburkholderia sp. BL18I3N2 TaxID=1938799 RepID=UPI000D06ED2B|nr:phage major capsid protein [Paraburkholderia sp. BL18I3N2]PRX26836.1 HK97 family phage major capsid protein [Paraburkholderia sp. BL18I3N2]